MNVATGKRFSFYLLYAAVLLILIIVCRTDGQAASSKLPQNQNDSLTTEKTAHQDPNTIFSQQKKNWSRPRSDERLDERKQMVSRIQHYYGLHNKDVLNAVLNVPRHWFVPERLQYAAYADTPLAIGHNQTISQPFIIAYMTGLFDLDPNDVVLEVGTGSGYQAAILYELTPHVFSIEILKPLADTARTRLHRRGYSNICVKHGDGYQGWPRFAPFDAIIVTCAPEHIPSPLLEQLAPGGKIVIPVGSRYGIQKLYLVTKDKQGEITKKSMMPVRFVPLTH